MSDWIENDIRVRYAETDQMGIVHHSNYFVWFELGRSEYCRAHGFSYKEMEDSEDTLMVVAEVRCRYKSPAFYEDVLTIRTKAKEVRSRGITFEYQIVRNADGIVVAEAETKHIVTDREKRVRTFPERFRRLLRA